MIPKRLIFIWLGSDVPEYGKFCMDNFKKVNPDFEIMFVYEPDMKNIKNKELKQFIFDLALNNMDNDFYHRIYRRNWANLHLKTKNGIYTLISDAYRFYLLNKYGGIYLDLDTFPTNQFDINLLENRNGFVYTVNNSIFCDIFFMGFPKKCVDNNLIFIDGFGENQDFSSKVTRYKYIQDNIYKNSNQVFLRKKNKFMNCQSKYNTDSLIRSKDIKNYYIDHYKVNSWNPKIKDTIISVDFCDFWGIAKTDTQKNQFFMKEIIRQYPNVIKNSSDCPDLTISLGFGEDFKKNKKQNRIQCISNEGFFNINYRDFNYFIGASDKLIDTENSCYIPWWLVRTTEYKFQELLNKQLSDEELLNRDFCCFLGRTDSDRIHRRQFIDKLNKYKKVNEITVNNKEYSFNNLENDKGFISKIDFVSKHKFNIAFENTNKLGYITEKPIDSFLAHSAPIYFGNIETFNKDFIWDQGLILKENNYDSLIERIKYLDTHDNEYIKLMRQQFLRTNIIQMYYDNLISFLTRIGKNIKYNI